MHLLPMKRKSTNKRDQLLHLWDMRSMMSAEIRNNRYQTLFLHIL